jgi:hypothetical protein
VEDHMFCMQEVERRERRKYSKEIERIQEYFPKLKE